MQKNKKLIGKVILSTALAFICFAALSGCGRKGNLTLEQREQKQEQHKKDIESIQKDVDNL